jgi:hypothetical protein
LYHQNDLLSNIFEEVHCQFWTTDQHTLVCVL